MLSYCQDVIDTIELLRSIFFDEEFEFSSQEDQQVFESLIEEVIPKEKEYLEVTIKTPVAESDVHLVFYCQIALMDSKGYRLTLPSSENGWLNRQDHEQVTAYLNEKNDKQEDRASEILENIQQVKSVAESIVMEQQEEKKEMIKDDKKPIEFLREWIWFPMIYTREKRGHIIDWAPSYQITGFLCPGKPGCMCLEGSKEKVAQFIHDIKTISWSDIPPSHKKMTSQWKEHVECDSKAQFESNRLFKDMTEIKFDIHGKFANHNDLNKLQTWMEKKGCGKAFDYLFECRET